MFVWSSITQTLQYDLAEISGWMICTTTATPMAARGYLANKTHLPLSQLFQVSMQTKVMELKTVMTKMKTEDDGVDKLPSAPSTQMRRLHIHIRQFRHRSTTYLQQTVHLFVFNQLLSVMLDYLTVNGPFKQ